MQTQMINLSIPKQLLKILDDQAKKEIKTRSELMRDAIRSYVNRNQQLADLFSFGQKQARKLKIKESQVQKIIDDYRRGK